MGKKHFYAILLDEEGEMVGVEVNGEVYDTIKTIPPLAIPETTAPLKRLKIIKLWGNRPCCVQQGGKLVCWPPCN